MVRLGIPLLLLAAAARALVAARTAMFDRDAATYVWMAQQVVSGKPDMAFQTVFHPLHSLLIAALLGIAPGVDPMRAAQIVSCGLAALAVIPLAVLTTRLAGRTAAVAAAVFYAVGVWFCRHPADGLSEGPFYLLVATTALLLVAPSRRTTAGAALAGLLAALAYGTRPEGASLWLVGAPWAWCRGERRRAVAFTLAFAAGALVWPLGWAIAGGGFTLTPKLSFNLAVGVAGSEGGLVHYLEHLARVPGALFEAIGYATVPLAFLGAWTARAQWRAHHPYTFLVGVFLLQVAVIPTLFSNIRFLSGYGILLLPLAGAGVAALWPRLAGRPALCWSLVALALAGDLVRLPQPRRADRVVLRELGTWLGARLRERQVDLGTRPIASDMPRLEFFAGQRPGPPRRIAPTEIVEACKSTVTRYAVFVRPRTPVPARTLAKLGFRRADLPPGLRELARRRHVEVYERRIE